MNNILLDTHVWIWYANGSNELTKSLQKTITNALADHRAYIAAISLWEVNMLEKKGRIILAMPCLEWINQFIDITHIQIVPLTPAIAAESCHLPGKFHDDPADRIIAATARIEKLLLVTRDERIIHYAQSKYISILEA